MNQERDRLEAQCREAQDADLVRILTVDRDHSVAALIDEAARELERRGLTTAGFLDRVEVQVGSQQEATVSVEKARSLIGSDVPVHAVATVRHALGETMVLQREGWGWVFHYYNNDTYGQSYLFEEETRARDALGAFLLLQPWVEMAGLPHHLDNWETVARTEEAQLIVDAAQMLTAAGILHIVRTPLFTAQGDQNVALLVAPEDRQIAEETLGISRQSIRQLKRRAIELADNDDRLAELALYDELSRVDAGNGAVHYNRGVVLLELNRPEEALAAFQEAAAPTLGNLPDRPQTPSGRVGPGGMFAIFGLLMRHVGGPPTPPGPDYLEDIELRLQALEKRLGVRADLLHTLAGLARWRSDPAAARQLYERILALDDGDDIARFQLSYLDASSE